MHLPYHLHLPHVIIILSATLSYLITLNGQFVFDDLEAVVKNPIVIRDDIALSHVWTHDFWGTLMTHESSHKSFRPLTTHCFRILRQISAFLSLNGNRDNDSHGTDSSLNPLLFHLSNITLYSVICLLLYFTFIKLFSLDITRDSLKEVDQKCFLSTLLFTLHPIHTESVCAIVGLADLTSALFFLISFNIYLKAKTNLSYSGSFSQCFSAIFFSAISMLCKEQGITALGMCFVYEIIYIQSSNRHSKSFKLLLFRISLLLSATFLLLFIRLYIMAFSPPRFHSVDNPASFEEHFMIRAINYNYIYALNAFLMLNPIWLCFDWSMNCIPLIINFTDFRIIFIVIFWLVMLMLVRACFYSQSRSSRRLLLLSLALCFVPFIPSSNILFRVGFVIAERALFIPSIGYSLIIVIGFDLLKKKVKCDKILEKCFYALLVIFFLRTIQRCCDWNQENTLYQSGLSVCPLNAKVHYNIAKLAADNGDKETAIVKYKDAIKLNPNYDHAMNNLANILKDQDQLEEAKSLLIRALQIRTNFAAAWMNLGIVQVGLKLYQDAEMSYMNAIKYRDKYADCFYNLGNLYVTQKKYEQALSVWRKATSIKPSLLSAWNNMVVMLDSIGDYDMAQQLALQALHFHPNQSSLYFNFANLLGKMNKYNESELYFKKAISISPTNALYFANLGVLYHRWNKYEHAFHSYKKALELNSNLLSAKENLQSLLKIWNKEGKE